MAERLKGLLDSARTKLGGLLGDFPQGFNAGAVAGVAGYPGDIAFMLDTAGRALTGQDTQPAAQDFPGTTEYIANKAGYPVPPSFSGQLGAAVGGVLTPGPGDLAKFAPVLSAIPFWHGSPHKYDAVDLSKIGTGEGAQAYGWGYYGADAENTARSYMQTDRQNKRVTGGLNPTQEYISDMMDKGLDPTTIFSRATAEGRKFSAQAGESPYDAFMREYSSLADSDAQSNLYRGEYRWPDPAKEAATPLTGEDLLDWDKPLSKQSPQVQKALAKAGYKAEVSDMFEPVPNDEYKKMMIDRYGTDDFFQIPREKWTEAQNMAMRPVRKMNDMSGQAIIEDLSGGDANYSEDATKRLMELGIPGIRYLDQMSRGAGEGTRNYVMFDDKGIKLLERNGKPIEDFAARRAGKAKPYREATGQRTLQDVVSELEQRGITVDAAQSGNNPDLVTLSRIVVPQEQRGQGVGTQAMQDLIGYADEQGKTIALSPSADFGASSVDRLKDFYKRFGFVDNKGKGRDFEISESMYRRGAK